LIIVKYRPFKPLNKTDRRWPDKVIEKAPIYSAVDLRDGNQALVKPMNISQKQRLFDLLVKLGSNRSRSAFRRQASRILTSAAS